MSQSVRMDALDWWKSLKFLQQMSEIMFWKENTTDFRKDWSFDMISSSSGTIETIYRQNKLNNE